METGIIYLGRIEKKDGRMTVISHRLGDKYPVLSLKKVKKEKAP